MTWLSYSYDEVLHFHPAFAEIANASLVKLGISDKFRWEHHIRTVGSSVIPDFVLVEVASNRWRLVVEIKRSLASVYSERSQVQSKGYAEANLHLYPNAVSSYFCVTNLEDTILFALNGNNPPKDCRIKDKTFNSGRFISTAMDAHKQAAVDHFAIITEYILGATAPAFETVWPRIVRTMLQHVRHLPIVEALDLNVPRVPDLVGDYFSGDAIQTSRRELLLRCLAVEYFRGLLQRYGHPKSTLVPALRGRIADVSNSITALRQIDFSTVFEDTAAQLYIRLGETPEVRESLQAYLRTLSSERVSLLAANRTDMLEFPDVVISETYPPAIRDQRGKAQTDPELAALLASLTMSGDQGRIIDPCCGDGNLLSAAYDVLRLNGSSHSEALSDIVGIEADSLAAKIAGIRLILKEPSLLARSDPNNIRAGDMFSCAADIELASAVLMNPPFKRYEAQDSAPLPAGLRDHYIASIDAIGNAETGDGQSNLYQLYVEFALKAAKPGAAFGIILDNKWFHNDTAASLRRMLLRETSITAVVNYPHGQYFQGLMIATSILILRKEVAAPDHIVQFLRCADPRAADFIAVGTAVRDGQDLPNDWYRNSVRQSELDTSSWKHHCFSALIQEYRQPDWPSLNDLFGFARRGSLAKEGGGIAIYEFPQNRTKYGPRRTLKQNRRPFQTGKGPELTRAENALLREAAAAIPADYLGFAINKADRLRDYNLTIADVTRDVTIEAPLQRNVANDAAYFSARRHRWGDTLISAVDQIRSDPAAGAYVAMVEQIVGLEEAIIPMSELWNCLREPYAGELVIPRKSRTGHRVHINPFALQKGGRQIRLSSNFLTYGECSAVDPETGLTREQAVGLVFAFLMSSFGQLQFEAEANNREGARSLEQHHVDRMKIFDPRWVRPECRQLILDAAANLPYPIRTDISASLQPELVVLDELFADEIVNKDSNLEKSALLEEVWQTQFDWQQARSQ